MHPFIQGQVVGQQPKQPRPSFPQPPPPAHLGGGKHRGVPRTAERFNLRVCPGFTLSPPPCVMCLEHLAN